MTAKDKLRQVVEELTEFEAEQVLEVITRRRDSDPVLNLFENAPIDVSAKSVDRRLAHRDHSAGASRPQTSRPTDPATHR